MAGPDGTFLHDFAPSGPPVCPVCGQTDCNTPLAGDAVPQPVSDMTERLYHVTEAVYSGSKRLYPPGVDIPLEDAVRLNLPGAREQAVNDAPRTRMVRLAEDRAVHAGEAR